MSQFLLGSKTKPKNQTTTIRNGRFEIDPMTIIYSTESHKSMNNNSKPFFFDLKIEEFGCFG